MNPKPSEQSSFIGIGVTIGVIALLSFFLDVEQMKAWVISVGVWAPLAFITLKILTLVVAPISGGPLYPLVGALFGFWPGILYVAIGDFIGYTVCFTLGRKFGRSFVEKLLGKKEGGMLSKIVDHIGTPKGFFHATLVLFVSPELLSYGAGLSRLPYRIFMAILWPVYLVVSTLLVFLGASTDFASNSIFISVGIPMLGTMFVIVGGLLFARAMKKRGQATTAEEEVK